MWKKMAVPVLILAFHTAAHACIPTMYFTQYFGESQPVASALQEKIEADIKQNNYTVIEYRIGTSRYPFVKKGDVIFMGGKPIATAKDSFWYLGKGYYKLNHELYYWGEHIGAAPVDGTVIAYSENRSPSRPDNLPPDYMWCPVSVHADILETTTGLRVEHVVEDN